MTEKGAGAVSRREHLLAQIAAAEAGEALLRRWSEATDEQRAQWLAEAAQRRADERAGARRVPLTMGALLDKLGWTEAYAEHVVQPYCECGDGHDGWERCAHASDEGIE